MKVQVLLAARSGRSEQATLRLYELHLFFLSDGNTPKPGIEAIEE